MEVSKNFSPYLFRHVETDAYAVIVLRQVADGAECRVATQGCKCLKEREQLFRLEEKAHARRGLGGITREGEQKHALELDGMGALVEGVGTAERLARYLGGETSVGLKLEVGVAAGESYLLVVGVQLLFYLRGNNLATGLGKEVLCGEGATGRTVFPCRGAKVGLAEGSATDDTVYQAAYQTACRAASTARTAAAEQTAEQTACRAGGGRTT